MGFIRHLLGVLAALAASASAANVGKSEGSLSGHLTGHQHGRGFVRGLEFRHRLRICNAYPEVAPLEVYRLHGGELTSRSPLLYKVCRDFVTPLKAGDKIEFRMGDMLAGTFSVSDLPNNDAVLFLVIHRHDTITTAVSFESHVFANLLNAQVAVIDTYRGPDHAVTQIFDGSRKEEQLRFNSVVAVNPGVYQVTLTGDDGKMRDKQKLVALNRESYVVLRTGVVGQDGHTFPQELVVYPESDEKMLQRNGAKARTPAVVACVLAVFSLFLH